MKPRRAPIFVVILPLLILTITILFAHPLGVQSPIEAWIGHELQHIATHFINPKLHFSRLSYHFPRTVIVHDLTLTAPDPLNPSRNIDLLSVKVAHLELAQIPHIGQALKIKQIRLDAPIVRLVATYPVNMPAFTQPATQLTTQLTTQNSTQAATTQPHPKIQFIGFSDFLIKEPPPGTPWPKPSDYFQITKIEVHDGLLQYDPRQANVKPFTLDGLNSTLNISSNPPTTAATSPATKPHRSTNGWYLLDCQAARDPIFSARLQGRINMNTGTIDFSPLTAHLALSDATKDHLPPNIQKVVDHFQARGALDTLLTGTLTFHNKSKTKLLTHVTLTDGHVQIGQCQLPIQKLVAELRTEDLLTRAISVHAEVLNGTIDAEGSLPFRQDQTTSLHIHVNNVGLAKTIRTVQNQPQTRPAQPSPVAGRVSGDISYSAPVAQWNAQMSGGGYLELHNGRIPDVPVLGEIVGGIRTFGKTVGMNDGKPNDTAQMNFILEGNKIIVQRLDAHSTAMGLRATGDIFNDGNVDLHVNAGPLERFEQLLGPVGDGLSKVTDNLASYHATGKPGHLNVSMGLGPG